MTRTLPNKHCSGQKGRILGQERNVDSEFQIQQNKDEDDRTRETSALSTALNYGSEIVVI